MRYFKSWRDHIDSVFDYICEVGTLIQKHGVQIQIMCDDVEKISDCLEKYCSHYGLEYVKQREGCYFVKDPNDKYSFHIITTMVASPDLFEVKLSEGRV